MLEFYKFKEINELFLKGRTEEARYSLMAMQEKYIALCDENSLLRSRLQEFEDMIYLARNVVYDGFSYWIMAGDVRQGPFCNVCYERDKKFSKLESHDNYMKCHVCGSTVTIPRHGSISQQESNNYKSAKILKFSKQ